MMQHDLKPAPGSRKPSRRVGRGNGSGRGDYCGRGKNGQKARTSPGPRLGFEGGQLALIKRMPSKRGFTNIFRRPCAIVNLRDLDRLPESAGEITPQLLLEMGLIDDASVPVKVLGEGQVSRPLVLKECLVSRAAREKVQAAGGKVET